jgi:hypothetical protein
MGDKKADMPSYETFLSLDCSCSQQPAMKNGLQTLLRKVVTHKIKIFQEDSSVNPRGTVDLLLFIALQATKDNIFSSRFHLQDTSCPVQTMFCVVMISVHAIRIDLI